MFDLFCDPSPALSARLCTRAAFRFSSSSAFSRKIGPSSDEIAYVCLLHATINPTHLRFQLSSAARRRFASRPPLHSAAVSPPAARAWLPPAQPPHRPPVEHGAHCCGIKEMIKQGRTCQHAISLVCGAVGIYDDDKCSRTALSHAVASTRSTLTSSAEWTHDLT